MQEVDDSNINEVKRITKDLFVKIYYRYGEKKFQNLRISSILFIYVLEAYH